MLKPVVSGSDLTADYDVLNAVYDMAFRTEILAGGYEAWRSCPDATDSQIICGVVTSKLKTGKASFANYRARKRTVFNVAIASNNPLADYGLKYEGVGDAVTVNIT